jgi:hypothetical protein
VHRWGAGDADAAVGEVHVTLTIPRRRVRTHARPSYPMKVTLDIDKLLREGRITSAEYTRLKGFAAADTGSLALRTAGG